MKTFLQETIGCAVIDSGCCSSVCGQFWLKTYVDTLSCKDRDSIKYRSSQRYYRFGDGKKVKAVNSVELPLFIGAKKTSIIVDVVPGDIPLLFFLYHKLFHFVDTELWEVEELHFFRNRMGAIPKM